MNYLIIPGQGEFGQLHPAGDGKIDNLFYSVVKWMYVMSLFVLDITF